TSVPLDVFGNVGSFHGGLSDTGTPARSIFPALVGFSALVGKHGLVVSPSQQSWLMPPLLSMHFPPAVFAAQASPVQVALQAEPPHPSSCTGTPAEGSPGSALHG